MKFNEFINQLETNKTVIAALLTGISRTEASWRPAKNRWTILEIINHLVDIEKADFRVEMKLILENPEHRWPRFSIEKWRVERKYNERSLARSVREFKVERDRSVTWLKSLGTPDLNAAHSGIGFKNGMKMRIGDLAAAWLAHDLYHIRHIGLAKWYLLNESAKPFSPAYSGFTI